MKLQKEQQINFPFIKKPSIPIIGNNKTTKTSNIIQDKIKEIQTEITKKRNQLEKDIKEIQTKQKDKKETDQKINKIKEEFTKWQNTKEKELKEWKKYEKPKEPVVFLIRNNNDIEIMENIPSGIHEIKRTDGKEAMINFSKSKMLTANWGGEPLRLWIAYEMEYSPLPIRIIHDSNTIKTMIEAIIANRGNLDIKKLKQWESIIATIVIGTAIIIAALIILPAIFHISIGDEIAKIIGKGAIDANTTIPK